MAELDGDAGGAAERSRTADAWDGLSEDTRLFLRAACLFDTERIPPEALAALLGVEGWDADLFQLALDEARRESTLLVDGDLLRVPLEIVGFVRTGARSRLPEDLLWAHLEGFSAAAEAAHDRPWDAEVVEPLLAFPLDRDAWEGLGSDIDEALTDLTPTLGRCLLAIDRPAQAIRWYERALPSLERTAGEVDERTEQGEGILTRLWEALFQIGTVRGGVEDEDEDEDDDDEKDEACLAHALSCFERAADVAERLSAVEPRWIERHGVTCLPRVRLLLGAKREAEALVWCDRAVRAFEASRALGVAQPPGGVSSALPLADCLAELDRDAEALVWFDRASAYLGSAADGGGRWWLLVATALRIGERRFFSDDEERRAASLPWLERALRGYEHVEVRDAVKDARMGWTLTVVGKLHFERANAARARTPPWVLPPPRVDLASVAEALSYFDRAAEFAETAEHVGPAERCFLGRYAHSMGGLCHHHAGRPAEAIASFERADALVERLGEAEELSIFQKIEALRVRGRCLDTLGRGEQAAVSLERAVKLAIDDAIADAAWEKGHEDFAALDAAEVQGELVELLDRIGASARVAPEHRVHAFLFQAYGLAKQDRPEEAVRWWERAELEGQERTPYTSRRIVMATARAVMGAFARADRPVEAVAWYRRFVNTYRSTLAPGPAKSDEEGDRALVALHGNGRPFEFTLERQLRSLLREIHSFFERIKSWRTEESGESEDPEDGDEDEEDGDEEDEEDGDEEDAGAPGSRR